MIDSLRQDLKIGDKVCFHTKWYGIQIGVIYGFTPKMVRIKSMYYNGTMRNALLRFPGEVIKIEKFTEKFEKAANEFIEERGLNE